MSIDYTGLRESFCDSESLWDTELNLWENFSSLFSQAVILPESDIQLPILVSCVLAPTQLMGTAPIVFVCGAKGTGKSQITNLACDLHGSEPLNIRSTPASIRNEIQRLRYEAVSEDERVERNTLLGIDNVNAESLREDFLFSILLAGYNRRTARITMSKGDGTNWEFDVFSKKILSTVHPIWSDPSLVELHRRSLYLFTEESEAAHEVIDLELVDVTPFRLALQRHWEATSNCVAYMREFKRLSNSPRKRDFTPAIWTLIKYTIPVGSLIGGLSVDALIDAWLTYLEFTKTRLTSKLPIQIVLDEFLMSNKDVIETAGYFSLKVFKTYLKAQIQQGLIEPQDLPKATEYLQSLGYKIISRQGQPVWKK